MTIYENYRIYSSWTFSEFKKQELEQYKEFVKQAEIRWRKEHIPFPFYYVPPKPDPNHFISNSYTYFRIGRNELDLHLNKLEEINIKNICNYKGWIMCRFFYWILDSSYGDKIAKWWLKLHWLKSTEFLIKFSCTEDGVHETLIWNEWKQYYADKEAMEKINSKRYKWKYKNVEIQDIHTFAIKCREVWFWKELIDCIFWYLTFIDSMWRKRDLSGSYELKSLFNSQLNLLKNIKFKDPDRRKLKKHMYADASEKFEEIYWYPLAKKYERKYKIMLNYIWKENRVFIFSKFKERGKRYFKILRSCYSVVWFHEFSKRLPDLRTEKTIRNYNYFKELYTKYKVSESILLKELNFVKYTDEMFDELVNEEYKMEYEGNFLFRRSVIFDRSWFNFSERIKFFKEEHKKLFPNEKFHKWGNDTLYIG